MATQISEERFPFHYEFIHHCGGRARRVFVKVMKAKEQIPALRREDLLARLAKGDKLRWGVNPDAAEVEKLEAQVACSHCGQLGVKYVWPQAG